MSDSRTLVDWDIVAYYAKRIEEYDLVYKKPERQSDLSILKTMVIDSFIGSDVLEIACGTGFWTSCIAEKASSILATDYNSEMLQKAASREYGTCTLDFQSANAFELNRLSRDFSAGFCGFFWSHVPRHKRNAFIKSFHSRLRDKSIVVIIDNIYVKGSSTPVSRMDNDGNTYQIRNLADGSVHEVLKNFPTEFELRDVLTKYSYSIEYIPLQYYWFLRYTVSK